MAIEFHAMLPSLLPKAIAWAEMQSSHIAHFGQPLNDTLISLARSVGVLHPDRIRIVEVDSLPMPDDPDLKDAALAAGLLGANMIGLTLGYSVYICRGQWTIRLLSHEFRHVCQYEKAGSIVTFLSIYLQQIVSVGYNSAPFEIDARVYERSHA